MAPRIRDQVTVAHLLTHTSAIDGDIFTDTGRGDDCLARYVGLLDRAPSAFPPGGAYSYCNSGWVLFGRMIEVLDGRWWDDWLTATAMRAARAGPDRHPARGGDLGRGGGRVPAGGRVRVWGCPAASVRPA